MKSASVENVIVIEQPEGRSDLPPSGHPTVEPSKQATGGPTRPRERPPKPVPFGSANLVDKDTDSRAHSDCCRSDFRRELRKRRQSLTSQEHGFLDWLANHGDEIEIATAREKLSDETLFFDLAGATTPSNSETFESHSIPGTIDVNNNSTNHGGVLSVDELRVAVRQKSPPPFDSSSSIGSNKRLEVLEARKKSDLHGRMWKAHESGLAFSHGASQKSALRRERSIKRLSLSKRVELVRNSSFLSTTTQELLLEGGPTNRPGENDIFRSSLTTIDPISRSSRSMSIGTLPALKSPQKLKTARLRRYSSADANRKSVTFKEHPLSDEESESRRGKAVRRMSQPLMRGNKPEISIPKPSQSAERAVSELSMESFPSIHHARAIRSDSISSIPSIHHGHPIRADSMSSIPSIHHAHPIRADSMSSIPSLHRAHPIRSDSIASSITSTRDQDATRRLSHEQKRDESNEPFWVAPLPKKGDVFESGQLLRHPAQKPASKPVLLRKASVNTYEGEGIEASEWNETDSSVLIESVEKARRVGSMVSVGSIFTSSSFDETKSAERSQIFRGIGRAFSDEEASSVFLGSYRSITQDATSSVDILRPEDGEEESWDLESEVGRADAWNVLKDEYASDYGIELPFRILGTSADDVLSHPHVLSPPLMESLQSFFPYNISEDNWWLRFSMIRDGASLHTLLQNVRGSKHTVLALETTDGEVFGSFTSATWRKNWNYFGSGESFLWRMRQSRNTPCHSIIDQARLESELDVYPWTGANNCIQLCTHDKIAVGSGPPDDRDDTKDHEFGFGIAIDPDLLHGTSSPCATFGSPSLPLETPSGDRFEIINLEVWTLTPCVTVEDAETLELGKLFLDSQKL